MGAVIIDKSLPNWLVRTDVYDAGMRAWYEADDRIRIRVPTRAGEGEGGGCP